MLKSTPTGSQIPRKDLGCNFQLICCLFLTILASGCLTTWQCGYDSQNIPQVTSGGKSACDFSQEDEEFLDDLERRIFNYFWTEIYPETGLAIDHTENRTGKVAATGFGLAAICIGVERGWISHDDGYQRVLHTLNAFWDDPDDPNDIAVDGKYGLWWHFVDGHTGKMRKVDCVAMCDSADLVAGAIIAGEYFKGTEIEELAYKIYDKVEWDKFVAKDHDGSPGLMSFGWVPHHVSKDYYEVDGLLPFNMQGLVDNSLLIYALGLGSDTHRIPQETWEKYVNDYRLDEYSGYQAVYAGALFVRQVPQAFMPMSRLRDRKIDYYADLVNALLADRVFNMRVNGYPPEIWGLNDCFGEKSYSHAAPPGHIVNDGTVACCSFEGALPHVPNLSLQAMRYAKKNYGSQVYGKYGFTSSINLLNGFISPRFVGIELGPAIMLLENARTGLIWKLFSQSRVMKNFVQRARMNGVIDNFELPPEAPPYAEWISEGCTLVIGQYLPQNGKKCLELKPQQPQVLIQGKLPKNDLLKYHFANYLSIWTRDLEINKVCVIINGKNTELSEKGTAKGLGWRQIYFQLPQNCRDQQLSSLLIKATVAGKKPAIDNISLEEQTNLVELGTINDLKAETGKLGSTIRLTWTVPENTGKDFNANYILALKESGEKTYSPLLSVKKSGESEDRLIALKSGKLYQVSLTPINAKGHLGQESNIIEVTANPQQLNNIAEDFSSGNHEKWSTKTPEAFKMTVKKNPSGNCLNVDFKKTHGWNFLAVEVDPEMVALHRYILLKVKSKHSFLGKLWCNEKHQQDIEIQSPNQFPDWSILKFDTSKTDKINPTVDKVKKVLFFPAPGDGGAQGSFEIDWVKYSN